MATVSYSNSDFFFKLVKRLTEQQQGSKKKNIKYKVPTSKFSLTSCIIFNFVSSAVSKNNPSGKWSYVKIFPKLLLLITEGKQSDLISLTVMVQ